MAIPPATDQPDSVDEQIAKFNRKFDELDTELQSIANSLTDDSVAEFNSINSGDSISNSIPNSFADPTPTSEHTTEQIQTLINNAIKANDTKWNRAIQANDTKWTETLEKLTNQLTACATQQHHLHTIAQNQRNTSATNVRKLESKINVLDNDLSATNLLIDTQSEKLEKSLECL